MKKDKNLFQMVKAPEASPREMPTKFSNISNPSGKNFKASGEGDPKVIELDGKLVLQIPKSLHLRLSELASEEGVSLEEYVLYKLSQ